MKIYYKNKVRSSFWYFNLNWWYFDKINKYSAKSTIIGSQQKALSDSCASNVTPFLLQHPELKSDFFIDGKFSESIFKA